MGHQFLFYSEIVDRENGIVIFDAEESHHLVKVLRLTDGDEIDVTDGCGWRFLVKLDIADASQVEGVILQEEQVETQVPLPIHIGIPCLKGDRWQLMVEIAAEIGVAGIIPVTCEKAKAPWTESKIVKANRKAREALKQSGGFTLTEVSNATNLTDLLKRDDFTAVYFADAEGGTLETIKPQSLVLIGPEAGFSTSEMDLLHRSAATGFSIGKRRFRSEIAAVMAIAQIQAKI